MIATMHKFKLDKFNFYNNIKRQMNTSNETKAATKRGLLICFEGVDRVGKSTQASLIKDYLNASLMRFPGKKC